MEIEKTRRNNNIRVWWFVSHLRSMYNDFPPVVVLTSRSIIKGGNVGRKKQEYLTSCLLQLKTLEQFFEMYLTHGESNKQRMCSNFLVYFFVIFTAVKKSRIRVSFLLGWNLQMWSVSLSGNAEARDRCYLVMSARSDTVMLI